MPTLKVELEVVRVVAVMALGGRGGKTRRRRAVGWPASGLDASSSLSLSLPKQSVVEQQCGEELIMTEVGRCKASSLSSDGIFLHFHSFSISQLDLNLFIPR